MKTRDLRNFYRSSAAWTALVLVASSLPTFAQENAVATSPQIPDGIAVKIEKTDAQPAVAYINKGGDQELRVDAAFDGLEKVPEEVREYVRAAWEKSGDVPAKKIGVKIDVSEAPDAVEWAEKAKNILIYWYPKIVEALDGPEGVDATADDFEITLLFKPMDGVAHTSGRTITVSSKWIERRPDDFGLVVHEAVHVAQHYRGGESWAVEGIADYVRYYISEPRLKNRCQIDPERSRYTDGYGVAATFFDWAIREKDPDFLKKMHRAIRSQKRVDEFFADEYETNADALWNEFTSSLTRTTRQD